MSNIIQRTRGALTRVALFIGLALASALAPAQTVTYLHNDASGTPVLATDASGNVVWKDNYLPYGVGLNNASGSGGDLRNTTGAPNSSLRELIDMNKQTYPSSFAK